MKLLYTGIQLLVAVQLVYAKSLNYTSSSSILSLERQLVKLYDKQLKILATTICAKLEKLSEQLLEDEIVQEAETPMLQEFKTNVTHFHQIYPYYVSLDLNETLVSKFANMMLVYYHPPQNLSRDFSNIVQLLRKLGYDEIRNNYTSEFMEFMAHTFLPKFQAIKDKHSSRQQRTKFDFNFFKWANNLKECREYECFLTAFKKSTLTPKDKLFGFLQRQILDLTISYWQDTTTLGSAILNDPRLSQLSPKLRETLVSVIKVLQESNKVRKEFKQMFYIEPFDVIILLILENQLFAPLKELYLLTTILEDHNFAQPELNFIQNFDTFLKYDILKASEHYRASLSPKELKRERAFFEQIERLKAATSSIERTRIYTTLGFMNGNELKKWRI